VAVGVRDAGHLGMESIVVLLPRAAQRVAEALIHVCVLAFAVLMAYAGWEWLTLKWAEPKPMLGVPEGLDYLPLVIAGTLIVLFCIEHLIALWRGQSVEEAGV
jgi:TRAP-type C4-dicarboxylate transport system permease small subunit